MSLFIIGGTGTAGNSFAATSVDGGITWTDIPNGSLASGSINAIEWNGSFWVLGSTTTNPIFTSPNGVIWTQRTTTLPSVSALCWNGSLWVAGGGGDANGHCIATSSDGVTWTTRTSPWDGTTGVVVVSSLAWSPSLGLFVACGNDDTLTHTIMTSHDGVTWTNRSTPVDPNGFSTSAVWGPGFFLVAAYTNPTPSVTLLKSTDGVTWSNVTTPWDSAGFINTLAWSGSLWVAAGASAQSSPTNTLMSSPDGTTWTNRTAPWDGRTSGAQALCYDASGGTWVAGCWPTSGSNIATSQNGVTWTGQTGRSSTRNITAAVQGSGGFYIPRRAAPPGVVLALGGFSSGRPLARSASSVPEPITIQSPAAFGAGYGYGGVPIISAVPQQLSGVFSRHRGARATPQALPAPVQPPSFIIVPTEPVQVNAPSAYGSAYAKPAAVTLH